MKKRFLAVVLTVTIVMTLTVGCGDKDDTVPSDTNSTTSLLVDADKESVDYAEESENEPVYGDTDYEYHSDTDTSSDDTSTDSTDSDISTDSETNYDDSGNKDNGGFGNGNSNDKGDKEQPISDEHIFEYFSISGNYFTVCGSTIDRLDSLKGEMYFCAEEDTSLNYDGYFKDQGNFTRGYWSDGKNSTKFFLETDNNGNITAIVMTDLKGNDTAAIRVGDEGVIKLGLSQDIIINEDTTIADFEAREMLFGKGDILPTKNEIDYLCVYRDRYATMTLLVDGESRYQNIKEIMIRRN